MTIRAQLELQGKLDHLRAAWQLGEAVLENVDWPEDPEGSCYHVLLAVQELLTNVLRHGYQGESEHPVTVGFTVDKDRIEILLRDRGSEFNPLEHVGRAEELAEDSEKMTETTGGYGIHIARVVLDDLWYARQDGWNELRMFKQVGATGGTQQVREEGQDYA